MNKIIIASAGSGKTTHIVEDVISNPSKKTAIVTYTINNVQEIKDKFFKKKAGIPPNVSVVSWFSFLLRDYVRPYQNFLYERRIESVAFVEGKSARFAKKTDIKRYYLCDGKKIFTDKISEFGLCCNEKSSGLVVKRLEEIYDRIYIDEIQDLAGYDLEILFQLLNSKIEITFVGDHRQATFQTNYSPKNKKYAGSSIINKFIEWEGQQICKIEYLQHSYRCNQSICDLADSLYPTFSKTKSRNQDESGYDGIYFVSSDKLSEFVAKHSPMILRYNKSSDCFGFDHIAMNWGDSKGLTFDHVLIIPHGPLKKFLRSGNINDIEGSLAKLYVALTRAKFSVTFLYEGPTKLTGVKTFA